MVVLAIRWKDLLQTASSRRTLKDSTLEILLLTVENPPSDHNQLISVFSATHGRFCFFLRAQGLFKSRLYYGLLSCVTVPPEFRVSSSKNRKTTDENKIKRSSPARTRDENHEFTEIKKTEQRDRHSRKSLNIKRIKEGRERKRNLNERHL